MVNRTRTAVVICVLAVLLFSAASYAAEEYQIEILPTVIVGEAYEDNIFLTHDNKKSDFITTVSPGVVMHVDSVKTRLDLEYFPTFVWYNDLNENDTVRHSAKLNLIQRFTKFLYLDLKESYIRTEDPYYVAALDPALRAQNIRRTRNLYHRNEASAVMNYQFGRHDNASLGFTHVLLENQDPLLDDATAFGPFASLTHWFDVRNGVELSYRFLSYEFDRESGTPLQEDLKSHDARVRYIHQFNPRTKVFLGYGLFSRDFDGDRGDYQVHEGRAGVEHLFDREWRLSLEAGSFKPSSGVDADEGVVFNTRLDKKLKRGSFAFGLDKGWDEGFLEPEARGFTEYWGAFGTLDYQILQKLFGHVDASYRDNDNVQLGFSNDYSTLYVNSGLKLEVSKWIFLGLEYGYVAESSDLSTQDFADNRVLLTLSAAHALYPLGRKPMGRRSGPLEETSY